MFDIREQSVAGVGRKSGMRADCIRYKGAEKWNHILKELKDEEYCVEIEALPKVKLQARKARELLTDLCVGTIVRQKKKAQRDVWRKL